LRQTTRAGEFPVNFPGTPPADQGGGPVFALPLAPLGGWKRTIPASSLTKRVGRNPKVCPNDAPVRQSTLNFNREILAGECGALVLANLAAPAASHFTGNAAVISATAVAATLVGGGLSWLAARIYDRKKQNTFNTKAIVSDIGYFTPGAIVLGFGVYDPAIYLVTHHLLVRDTGVGWAVLIGQVVAFTLFLLALNAYRFLLLRFKGKEL
jgi:hypothetical protein